jgi:CubicO group peptidase (beta-lactamase class C family)
MKHGVILLPGILLATALLINYLTPVVEQDYWPTEGWRTATPEDQGMSSAQLAAIFDYIAEEEIEIHSILIVRNGCLVLEAYRHGYDAAHQHILYSVTKSVTSALIGIAIEEGYIESVEQPILEFFPDRTFENTDDAKRAISVEDVLTMRAGIDWQMMLRYQMFTEPDWAQFVLDRPMITEPGTEFLYNDGTAFVLSVVLQNASGVTTIDFADKHLFQPLGITDFTWETSTQGFANTSWGLHLTPRDMAKFGYLYLHGGEWDGRQIVPDEWVKASTQPHVDLRAASDPVLEPDDEAYGYMWWIYPRDEYYAAQGQDGQQIWVLPDYNLVVVITAEIDGPTTPVLKPILDGYIIPSIVSDTPLDPDPSAFTKLEAQSLNQR